MQLLAQGRQNSQCMLCSRSRQFEILACSSTLGAHCREGKCSVWMFRDQISYPDGNSVDSSTPSIQIFLDNSRPWSKTCLNPWFYLNCDVNYSQNRIHNPVISGQREKVETHLQAKIQSFFCNECSPDHDTRV